MIYTGSILDHEVTVQDHVFIAPGCNIAGRVQINESAFIGIGTTIKENISIGSHSTLGAGSVVLNDVPSHAVVGGIPARNLR